MIWSEVTVSVTVAVVIMNSDAIAETVAAEDDPEGEDEKSLNVDIWGRSLICCVTKNNC